MSNPKIEKVLAEIKRTKTKILDYQSKLRELEKQKTVLEDLEIVALFRSENFNFEQIKALMHGKANAPLSEEKKEEFPLE